MSTRWASARSGLYLGTYAAVAIMVRLFGSARIDRIGLVRMLAVAGTFVGFQFLVLGVTASVAGLLVAAVLGGLGHGFLFPLITTSLVNRTRLEERGTALAIFSGLIDMVYLLGAPAVGVLIVASGYPTTFSTVAIVILAGLAGFIVWERARPAGGAGQRPGVTVAATPSDDGADSAQHHRLADPPEAREQRGLGEDAGQVHHQGDEHGADPPGYRGDGGERRRHRARRQPVAHREGGGGEHRQDHVVGLGPDERSDHPGDGEDRRQERVAVATLVGGGGHADLSRRRRTWR